MQTDYKDRALDALEEVCLAAKCVQLLLRKLDGVPYDMALALLRRSPMDAPTMRDFIFAGEVDIALSGCEHWSRPA